MGQHFLLSRDAKSLSLGEVFRMSDTQAETLFRKVRWPETAGEPVCSHCGSLDAYDCRRPNGAPRLRHNTGATKPNWETPKFDSWRPGLCLDPIYPDQQESRQRSSLSPRALLRQPIDEHRPGDNCFGRNAKNHCPPHHPTSPSQCCIKARRRASAYCAITLLGKTLIR